jgi:hypothetical protein
VLPEVVFARVLSSRTACGPFGRYPILGFAVLDLELLWSLELDAWCLLSGVSLKGSSKAEIAQ